MRIVFAGTPEIAATSLALLAEGAHEIVGVMTREDAPHGRKRVMTPSPVAAWAQAHGVPVRKTNRPGSEDAGWVRERGADIGVVVAYGALLDAQLLGVPRLGWINLHFSKLPALRGAAPVQRAIMAGETSLGMTVFRLVEALDAGDILATGTHEIVPGTTSGEALEQLTVPGTKLLEEALRVLDEDPSAGWPQVGTASYAHKLTREDGKLNLGASTQEILATWAGVTPEPGAYVRQDGETVKIHELRVLSGGKGGEPGMAVLEGKTAMLHTRDGALELVTVQPAGKPRMPGEAWLRGRGGSATLQ